MSTIDRAIGRLEGREPPEEPEEEGQPGRPRPEPPSREPARRAPRQPGQTASLSPPTADGERLVVIDPERLSAGGYLVPGGPENRLGEEFQYIKRRVLGNMVRGIGNQERPANLLMVTSALPGEGKTFTSINLAISLTMELDRTVLLIDADIAKGDLSRVFGVHERKGLFDLLESQVGDVGELLVRTSIPNLVILPAGQSRLAVTEKLASRLMASLADELARRYDDRVVLFDSPPILLSSGALALAEHVGQVLLVVEAEKTPLEAVRRAQEQLEHAALTGTILNKARSGGNHQGYGYPYGNGG